MTTVAVSTLSRAISERHTDGDGRLTYRKRAGATPRTRGGYYWRRGPLEGARPVGEHTGGYLNGDGSRLDEGAFCALRVYPCHEFKGNHGRSLIDHTGWYSDEHGDRETIYGIVARLPHGRGFLAGWTMGAGMCATLSRRVYDSERDAVYAADSIAQRTAEDEREYQRGYDAARRVEDLRETIASAREEHCELVTELREERATRRSLKLPERPRVCAAMRAALAKPREECAAAVREIRALLREYGADLCERYS